MAPQHHRQPHSFLETHPSRKTFSPYATNTTNISMHQNKPYNEPLKWEGEKKIFQKNISISISRLIRVSRRN